MNLFKKSTGKGNNSDSKEVNISAEETPVADASQTEINHSVDPKTEVGAQTESMEISEIGEDEFPPPPAVTPLPINSSDNVSDENLEQISPVEEFDEHEPDDENHGTDNDDNPESIVIETLEEETPSFEDSSPGSQFDWNASEENLKSIPEPFSKTSDLEPASEVEEIAPLVEEVNINEEPAPVAPADAQPISSPHFEKLLLQLNESLKGYQSENISLLENLGKSNELLAKTSAELEQSRNKVLELSSENIEMKSDIKEFKEAFDEQELSEKELRNQVSELRNKIEEISREKTQLEVVNTELRKHDQAESVGDTAKKMIEAIEAEKLRQAKENFEQRDIILQNANLKAEQIGIEARLRAEEVSKLILADAEEAKKRADEVTDQANKNLQHSTRNMEEISKELIEQGKSLIDSASLEAEATLTSMREEKVQLEAEVNMLKRERDQLNGYVHALLERLRGLSNKINDKVDQRIIPPESISPTVEAIAEEQVVEEVSDIVDVEVGDVSEKHDQHLIIENKEVVVEEQVLPEPVLPEPVLPEPSVVEESIPAPSAVEEPILEEITVEEEVVEEPTHEEEVTEVVEEPAHEDKKIITYNDFIKQQEDSDHYEDPGE